MTNPSETVNISFSQEEIVYDNDCVAECDKDEKLAFVSREDPEEVIHESCLFLLPKRNRAEYIAIKDVPSGIPTAAEKVDAMVGESLDADEDKEYELHEPVEVQLNEKETVEVPPGMEIISIEFGPKN